MNDVELFCGNALSAYESWPSPTLIVSDGPYGVGSAHGDLSASKDLPAFYEPHVAAWSSAATLRTSLWFWGTEVGWATVHPLLTAHGWRYMRCCVWDKGIAHIAGNCNVATLRRLPVVSEVAVHYVYHLIAGMIDIQDWFLSEWRRTGLPGWRANEACGVKDAATRKYLTKQRDLWYLPPPDRYEALRCYADDHGNPAGRPYFVLPHDQVESQRRSQRAVFNSEPGVTNVWRCPALRGLERLKVGGRALHLNQKPLSLIESIVRWCSDPGDVVWDPFAGTGTVGVACARLGRGYRGSEIDEDVFVVANDRVRASLQLDMKERNRED